jgi:hypothetical protein
MMFYKPLRGYNKPFIWVIDDNYSALHIENGKPVHEEVKNEKYERMFKDSSHVLVLQ